MDMRETVKNAQTEAMREKLRLNRDPNATAQQIEDNDVRLQSFRAVNAAVLAQETGGKTRKDLDEQGIIQTMRKLVKSRRETAEEFASLGKTERAERENAEADTIESFLPKQMDEDETRALVSTVIQQTGAEGKQGMGAVMKVIKTRDDVDPTLASKIARELLA